MLISNYIAQLQNAQKVLGDVEVDNCDGKLAVHDGDTNHIAIVKYKFEDGRVVFVPYTLSPYDVFECRDEYEDGINGKAKVNLAYEVGCEDLAQRKLEQIKKAYIASQKPGCGRKETEDFLQQLEEILELRAKDVEKLT